MSIDAFEVARKAMRVAGRIPVSSLPRLATSLASDSGELTYAIEGFVDDEGHPGATLSLHGALQMICQRCSDPWVFELHRTERFRFVRNEAELELVPLDDDSTEAVVGSKKMDLREWIEDEAILALPLVPKHENCRPSTAAMSAELMAETDAKGPFADLASLKRPAN